ncbi:MULTISPECIES: hypothetical protein [Stenotrophomonas]|uniref:hypothetical protein n=1 Tax=Stenotrophomonas geniculata TaxID=86188 RepID=UPI00073952D2|nr:hypothetical protein [Stenotrophomonas maltophilia]CRD61458.1 conserved hypothetical protein [Stenotrophomonas maltophilia]
MAEFILKHVKHPGFSSKVATGVAAGGPTGDGNVHLTFYRDGVDLIEEYFEREEKPVPGGKAVVLSKGKKQPKSEFVREDLVRLVIPIDQLDEISELISKLALKVAGLKQEDDEAESPEEPEVSDGH